MERGIVLECINCGQPCANEQLNCANCQQKLHNKQGEGSSLIDKELEEYVGRQYPYYKKNGSLKISELQNGAGMVGLLFLM